MQSTYGRSRFLASLAGCWIYRQNQSGTRGEYAGRYGIDALTAHSTPPDVVEKPRFRLVQDLREWAGRP